MSVINKCGESSINQRVNDTKLRTILSNALDITIDKHQLNVKKKRITNLRAPSDINDAVTKAYLSKKNGQLRTKIVEFKTEYNTQMKIISSDIEKLYAIIDNNVKKDVNVIEKAINERIISVNKDFEKKIEERFNNIENFLYKYLKKNNEDVEKTKLKPPFIKF